MKKLIFVLTLLASFTVAAPTFAYTVEKGDTMTKIARNHGLSLKELADANPQVKDLDVIIVGQEIHTNTPKASNHTSREQENEKHNTIKTSFTEADIDLLARIVRAEAQTEPFEGKVAVAGVVLNRVESPKFPNSIKKVIYQKGQFQPVSNGEIKKPADKESIKAVYEAIKNRKKIAKDSLFFYNPTIATSRWLDTRKTTVVIGRHVFKN